MTRRLALGFMLLTAFAAPLRADDVSDALQGAMDAYDAGDLAKAGSELALASQALSTRQSALMATLLPPPPEGWAITPAEDFAQGFAIAGGGSGAEARYDSADRSQSFTISYIADNPMVASMAAMLGNIEMMKMMGTVITVGEQPVLVTDGNLSALVGGRVLFQAQGASVEVMMPVVQVVDFVKLSAFDRQ